MYDYVIISIFVTLTGVNMPYSVITITNLTQVTIHT